MWQRGQKKKLADLANISIKTLGHIIHRRRQAKYPLAVALERASTIVLGIGNTILKEEWMQARTSDNKYFYGRGD